MKFQNIRIPEDRCAAMAARFSVPGFTYALIQGGHLQEIYACGRKDAAGTPMEKDTVFEAASLTKPLFAVIVLRLAERGVFDLDDCVYELAPELAISDDPRIRSVTIRHILTHSCGLSGWGNRPHVPMLYDPGCGFSYSGEGFYWLQHVVEKLTGKDFCTLMQEELLTPLSMADSSPVWTSLMKEKGSHAFDEEGNELLLRNGPDFDSAVPEPNAAWSLYTTAGDYAKFLLELLNWHGHLSARMFTEMTTGRIRAGRGVDWGLGFGVPDADSTVVWHWGDNGAYRSFMALDRAQGDGIVLFCNSAGGAKLCIEALRYLTGSRYWDDVETFVESAE